MTTPLPHSLSEFIARLIALGEQMNETTERYRRHHPSPMPPGGVTLEHPQPTPPTEGPPMTTPCPGQTWPDRRPDQPTHCGQPLPHGRTLCWDCTRRLTRLLAGGVQVAGMTLLVDDDCQVEIVADGRDELVARGPVFDVPVVNSKEGMW